MCKRSRVVVNVLIVPLGSGYLGANIIVSKATNHFRNVKLMKVSAENNYYATNDLLKKLVEGYLVILSSLKYKLTKTVKCKEFALLSTDNVKYI